MTTEVQRLLTEEFEPQQEGLQKVFCLAELLHTIKLEEEQSKVRARQDPYHQYNSGLACYEDDHRGAPETMTAGLDRIVAENGQAVCILFGSNDNPFKGYMQRKQKEAEDTPYPVVMITVALEDRRDAAEKERDAAYGRFVVSGSVGTASVYEALHQELDWLRSVGVIKQNKADMLVSRLVGGWNSIPFVENAEEMVAYYANSYQYSLYDDKFSLLEELYSFFANLTLEEQKELGEAYISWMIRQMRGLLRENKGTIFGEIPTKMDKHVQAAIPSRYYAHGITFQRNRFASTFYLRY